jgi:hypothetical protein
MLEEKANAQALVLEIEPYMEKGKRIVRTVRVTEYFYDAAGHVIKEIVTNYQE